MTNRNNWRPCSRRPACNSWWWWWFDWCSGGQQHLDEQKKKTKKNTKELRVKDERVMPLMMASFRRKEHDMIDLTVGKKKKTKRESDGHWGKKTHLRPRVYHHQGSAMSSSLEWRIPNHLAGKPPARKPLPPPGPPELR